MNPRNQRSAKRKEAVQPRSRDTGDLLKSAAKPCGVSKRRGSGRKAAVREGLQWELF